MTMRTKLFFYTCKDNTLSVASEGFETVTVSLDKIPKEIHSQILMHGLKQLVGDAAAAKTGTPVPERIESMQEKIAQLYAGKFRADRESSGPQAGKRVRALFRVATANTKWAKKFMDLNEVTLPSVRDWHASQTDEMRKTIAQSQEIKTELATMAAEDAKDSGTSLMS